MRYDNNLIRRVNSMEQTEQLLRHFNEAYVSGNVDAMSEMIADEIEWDLVGDQFLSGKEAVVKMLHQMVAGQESKLSIERVIMHGKLAVINGIVEMQNSGGEWTKFGFCDIYELDGFKNARIKKMTSYVLLIPEQQ